jgi:hypothetical protein
MNGDILFYEIMEWNGAILLSEKRAVNRGLYFV